jgi:hypothetical protein
MPWLFNEWWLVRPPRPAGAKVWVYEEESTKRAEFLPKVHATVADHYLDPATTAVLSTRPRLEKVIKTLVPDQKRIQSGDLAEILASEFTEPELGFRLAAKRLRGKEERNQSMRGDDLIAIRTNGSGNLEEVLKGEVKSRMGWSLAAVKEALKQLDRGDGRPKASSVGFLIQRAAKDGDHKMVELLERLLDADAVSIPTRHAVFLLFGKVPEQELDDTLLTSKHNVPRIVVAFETPDHAGLRDQAMNMEAIAKVGAAHHPAS